MNSIQIRDTRWSIRRLSVGVASVVASGFFVPSWSTKFCTRADSAQVVPDATSVMKPAEVLKAVDVALLSEQSIQHLKQECGYTAELFKRT